VKEGKKLFCAAPWLEAVVRMDGQVYPCCRSDFTYGKLDGESSLSDIWHGERAQSFRADIAQGRFPSEVCANCVAARRATSLSEVLDAPIAQIWRNYDRDTDTVDSLVAKTVAPFHDAIRSGQIEKALEPACALLSAIDQIPKTTEKPPSVLKLRTVAQAVESYALGESRPKVLVPLRQVSLVAVCNARCIHCVGFYSDEIRKGQHVGDRRMKRVESPMLELALEKSEDVIGFFLNGSEFFLYPQWKDLLERFESKGIQIGIATNAMLLNDQTIAILTESQAIRDINISFDGCTVETVERIRVPVKFQKLRDRTEALIKAINAAGRDDFPLALSMVLMKGNHHEAPGLVALASELSADLPLRPHVSFSVLDATNQQGYVQFRAREYTDIQDPTTRAYLAEAENLGRSMGISTFYTFEGPLKYPLAAYSDSEFKDRHVTGELS